jgi:hypothetical protein
MPFGRRSRWCASAEGSRQSWFLSVTPLTAHDKFEIYIHKAYSPAAVIYPLFSTGITMAKPKTGYHDEWKDGMGWDGRVRKELRR